MRLCPSCKGDGLKHPHPDIFQIVEDRPCYECAGKGIVPGFQRIIEELMGIAYVETSLKIIKSHTVRTYYEPSLDMDGELDIVEILIAVGREWRIVNLSELNRTILVEAAKEHYQESLQGQEAIL